MNVYRWACAEGHYQYVATDFSGVPQLLLPGCPFVGPDGEMCLKPLTLTVTTR